MSAKVLISTAWSPTHSWWFSEYSQGIANQILPMDVTTEFFITTTFATTKFESIVGSMLQAQRYAIYKEFTHLLNVEADRLIGHKTLDTLLRVDRDVVLGIPSEYIGQYPVLKSGPTEYRRVSDEIGWGVMLVKTNVLLGASFEAGLVGGGLMWPDRMWIKYCLSHGVDIAVCAIEETILTPASKSIDASFAPDLV
jgi:hypothetical protein